MTIFTQGPFRWRWGLIAGACRSGRMAPGASAAPAGLLGRAPLIFLIGSLVLRDLSRPDSRIRKIATMLLGRPAVEDRTAVVIQPAAIESSFDPLLKDGKEE